ncbi:MAG TPA: helix-turn-helix domain-containing protein [Gemmatimonadaceae bacterium]|nr:helix-turn-helix domain-containing protein [Gemmatimonadaceae bacterium]
MSNRSRKPEDPLLTMREAAEELGVDPETIRRWARKGVISYVAVGPFRRKRIRRSVVDHHRQEQRGVDGISETTCPQLR